MTRAQPHLRATQCIKMLEVEAYELWPAVRLYQLRHLAPGETWGFSKRKWGLKSGGKSPPRKQKWELKVGV